MSSPSYFTNANNFAVNKLTFNNYSSESDAFQYLHKHSATSAMHDSEERYPPPLCHPGTREVVVARIEGWYGLEIPPKKKIMWVHAPAGYGKTAVAGTVAKNLDSRTRVNFNPVGATFFFWRTSPERNSPTRFIITLAYQLAMSIPEIAPHMEAAVKRNPMVLNKALEVQAVKLLIEPFKSLGKLDEIPHRLVIVDGLDECINSDQESLVQKQYAEDQERAQARILDLIYTLQSHHLPLCFLILSRPEPWIERHIRSRLFQVVTETLDLYQVGDHLKDAEKFVRVELSRIAEKVDHQNEEGSDDEWPCEGIVHRLLSRVEGHMLYATTIIRHIDDPYDDPRQRLQDILNSGLSSTPNLAQSTPFCSLHELYRQILRSSPLSNRATMVEVLEEILAARYHFPTGTGITLALKILDRISGRAPGRGIIVIRPLHAVIRLADSDTAVDGNFFYHSSFAEFLENEPRLLPDVTIDVQKGVGRVLAGCLNSISSITMDSRVDEDYLLFALSWGYFWREWMPSDKAEFSSQLRVLLAVDLAASFSQEIDLSANHRRLYRRSSFVCTNDLFHPTANLIVDGKSVSNIDAPLAEDAVSHLRSAVEGAFLHVLAPEYFRHHCHDDFLDTISGSLAHYLEEIDKYGPHEHSDVYCALETLRLEEEELYLELESWLLVYWWEKSVQQP
ncbi:hypothetical protein H1R20_g3827, partial [Candolleomyces eurysporus]